MELKYNEEEIRLCYRFLNHLNQTEIRLIHPQKSKNPQSVFVSSEDEFVEACKKYNGQFNVYAGINEREEGGKNKANVISVQTVVLDIDAKREKGFEKEPATQEELAGAEKIANRILETIKKSGQPLPVKLCSGNGYQLWFAIPKINIDEDNRQKTEEKLQLFQDKIIEMFDEDNTIDKIGDLPRIIKVWGTLNIKSGKGVETQERPYRIATVVSEEKTRVENPHLKERILELEKQKDDFERTEVDNFELISFPPCVMNLLVYENKDGKYWYRIIQFLASYCYSIGISTDACKKIIYDWNRKQVYHEEGEEAEIEQIITRIYKNKINVPNCKKIKSEAGGFPYFGLKDLKLCKPDTKCTKCISPVVRFKRAEEFAKQILDKESAEKAVQSFINKEDLALQILRVQPMYFDEGKNWWVWNGKKFRWVLVDEVDILNYVRMISNSNTIQSKEKLEILEALRQYSRVSKPKEIKPTWVQFQDTIVDVWTGEEFKASPEYFVTNPIIWELHPERFVNTPNMDKIFEEWVGKNYVLTLYQLLAFSLLPSYPMHRLFCLIGGGMNGKTAFLRLLTKFVGKDNLTATELDTLLASRFEITRLHKKLCCIMGETNFSEINKTSILKKLTGEDLIGFEYKNKNPITDYNFAKIFIATNNLPSTTDKTVGFYRRWLIIDFPNQFSEKKDILADIPDEEYQALAVKSLGILKDLLTEKQFHNEGTIEQRAEKYEAKSNFFDAFWKEFVVEDFGNFITVNSFAKELESYCYSNRHRMLSSQKIKELLKEKGIEQGNPYIEWTEDGKLIKKQVRAWMGIKWKN